MNRISYKGRKIIIGHGEEIDESVIDGESWLEMRKRTQPLRDERKKEDLQIAKEVASLLALGGSEVLETLIRCCNYRYEITERMYKEFGLPEEQKELSLIENAKSLLDSVGGE